MTTGQRVLVVDGLAETEAVLKAVLEPRGLQVDRIRAHQPPDRVTRGARPNVVVLEAHEVEADSNTPRPWDNIPRVIIGAAEIPEGSPATSDEQHLSKPFHYGELIQAIERLLATQ